MKRWLYAYRVISGNPAQLDQALRTRVVELLCAATDAPGGRPAVDGSFRLRFDTGVGRLPVTRVVRVRTGVAAFPGARTKIPITWQAESTRAAFPRFEGAIELVPLSRGSAQLTVVGSYTLPLGPLGAAADVVALHAIAERTADRLVGALARELAAPGAGGGRNDPGATPRFELLVADVMTADPLVMSEDMPVRSAALLLFHFGIAGAPVISANGGLVGVLSEADLLEKEALPGDGLGRAAAQGRRRRRALTAGEACSRPARVTIPQATVHAAARAMIDHHVARLVVVHESRVAGIVSRHDVLEALVRTDAEVRAVCEEVLSALGETRVAVAVEWGEVTLGGSLSRRSRTGPVVRAIEDVDGVIAVRSRLGWDVDDVLPRVLSLLPPA